MKVIVSSVAVVATVSLLLSLSTAEEVVVFGDNVRLTPVNESSLDSATAAQVIDPKNTGSRLFDVNVVGEDTRLSLNFPVKKFKSESSNYFRAHPAFMRCLQKTVNYVYQDTKKTIVLADRGFKTLNEAPGSSDIDQYSRSGTGAALKFQDGGTDVASIAEGILVHCPFIFGMEMRDIGVILMSDRVFVYMAGTGDKEPVFKSQGGSMDTNTFKSWCLEKIDGAIDPVKVPSCSNYTPLTNGGIYPSGATSPEEVVGSMDVVITRDDVDFKRLVQFARRSVLFDNTEHVKAWCGKENNPCVDCRAGIQGQAPSSRCADRMMSPRLYRSMRILQKLARENGNELKVIDAWDEPYKGFENGDHGLTSLHREGRAAILTLKVSSGNLGKLTQWAICSQMDYVQLNSNNVFVAVKKQANVEPMLVNFPEAVLLDVVPPTSKATDYELPEIIVEDGTASEYPLFDGNVNTKLGVSSESKDFHAESTRYFRADPALVQCYDEIVAFETRWSEGKTVNIKIKKAFLTVQQQEDVGQERGDSHLLGQALELTYDPSLDQTKYTMHRLAKAAIDQCGPIFYKENWNIGVGVSEDSVFIGMMEEKGFWVHTKPPSGLTPKEYENSLEERFYMAVHGYVVDPLNPAEACTQVPVKKQSPNFRHEHPTHVARRRKRGTNDDCVPSSNIDFCRETEKHRKKETTLIWEEVKRMHLYHNEQEVKEALEGCFENCGNCVKGSTYEDKTENCNNFLHWAPFSLMNEDADVTNFFYKDNDIMRDIACAGSEHCIDKAPLFAQLAPSLERLYRPDEEKSIEEELYGVMDNPLPVYELLIKMYAMHAKGKVKAWVKNEVEVEYIRNALEVVMLHNKDVTEVEIFVSDNTALMAVDGAVESMIADWVKSGCPKNTRETITPFRVSEIPTSSRKKRSTDEFNLGHELREKRKYFEQEWIRSSQIN